jgi:hypothetical protein
MYSTGSSQVKLVHNFRCRRPIWNFIQIHSVALKMKYLNWETDWQTWIPRFHNLHFVQRKPTNCYWTKQRHCVCVCGTSRRMWEDDIKTDLNEIWCEEWNGFNWLKIVSNGEVLWIRSWNLGFQKTSVFLYQQSDYQLFKEGITPQRYLGSHLFC